MIKKSLQIFILPLIFILGCSPNIHQSGELPLSEAQNDLIQLAKDDYQLDLKVKSFKNTVWIYVPLEENFLEIKASDPKPVLVKEVKKLPAINFLDVHASGNDILIEYDVGEMNHYEKDLGYASTYSEKFRKVQQNIIQSVHRIYSELDKDQIPDFFITLMADIKSGLITQMTFYIGDVIRAHHDPSFSEEYTRRIMSDTYGDKNIIGDKEGRYVKYKEMTWPEFLTEQIQYRINYKYSRSAFPPGNDAKAEILLIVKKTIDGYSFDDFENIILKDLVLDSQESMAFIMLDDYVKEKADSGEFGRLINIKFN